MSFKAYTHGNGKPQEYGNDDVYEFHEGGVLEIRPEEGSGKWPEFYAPHKWDQIIAEPNHKRGKTSGEGDVLPGVY